MRTRFEKYPTGSHRSTERGGIGLLLLVGLLVAVLAAACGESAIPRETDPTPMGLATPTPQLPGSGEDPATSQTSPTATVVLAPVESIQIEKVAAKHPNASMTVVSELPSGCDSFNGYSLTREGDEFNLEVTNLSRDLDCPATYTTVTTSILLEQPVYGNVEPCKTYPESTDGQGWTA